MVPLIQAGKMWFARELMDTTSMKELQLELEYVTYDEHGRVQFGAVHDDGLDIISQLSLMDIFTPSSDSIGIATRYKDPLWYETEPENTYISSYVV